MRAQLIYSVPRDSVATETEISADVSRRPRKLKKLFLKICHGHQKLWSDANVDIGGSLVSSRLSFFRRVNVAVFQLSVFFVLSLSLIVSFSFFLCMYLCILYIFLYFNLLLYVCLSFSEKKSIKKSSCPSLFLFTLSLVPINFCSFSSPYFLPPFFLCWVWWTL